jgi:hypothetical protein
MAEQHDSGSGGNGAAKKPPKTDIKGLLQKYLDSFTDEDQDDPDAEPTPSVVDSLDSEEKIALHYQGQLRTTTGIVKIMRENGDTESAELLEELRQTQESARQLLDQLKDLHQHRTGAYSRPTLKPQTRSDH